MIASSLTRLLAYIVSICALPIIEMNATKEMRKKSYKLPGGYLIPGTALIICLWITAQSNIDAWILTFGLLALGLILFALARRSIQSTT